MGSIPSLAQEVKDPALPWAVVSVADVAQSSCGCGCGGGNREAGVAPIRPLPYAHELPYAEGATLKSKRRKTKQKAVDQICPDSFLYLGLFILKTRKCHSGRA